MGQAVIVAPGRPADVHVHGQVPDLSALRTLYHGPWDRKFQWPGFQQRATEVPAGVVLTLTSSRGEVIDVKHMMLALPVTLATGDPFTPVIPLPQKIVDQLAILLAGRSAPGHWSLDWDRHVPLPGGISLTGNVDSGPIFSALHRAWHDIIPAGCAPCKDADADTAVGTWTKGLVPA